ncbi:bifunctional ADP-dependent NAD(P)H-hydrate dehydratase/NAD(P)H-hydrate epimerase [Arthrobacter sp. STN4]|uniref:bifunctional ADP-dependent NAD(P)H-hydrate dehydratase/NAD(P)H-hydrate epimerase n=1 Tax=Arthrobacter sp. STN4 TaxID=2923276 RepID=UPI00211A6BD9|nr:bifunctional ADP-dependent NAD(P)H-hydrate dehydratase/NAD(P)H-hydrate epimerase [Arthrobacter sp. STN4]MCQ9164631.1 bifunctional ADP-dependent NAD(P)H-hydrate dehydratase/NAD(P)H-hydrate epimerase [Arthrobacter sp. STN4]
MPRADVLPAYTAAAVRAAEQPLLEAGCGPELMQRAAYGLAMGVVSVLRGRGCGVYGSHVALLVGSGNNGGDALFAGAWLAGRGARAMALLTSTRTHPGALAAFTKAGGLILSVPEGSDRFCAQAAAADVIVDGLLGTGGHGGLREPAASIVARLCKIIPNNPAGPGPGLAATSAPAVVACDLPSGVDATTGEVHGPVLPATLTVTFGAAKTGLLAAPGEQLSGGATVVGLGIEDGLGTPDVLRLQTADLAALLPRPEAADQKYTRGVAGIVAGSADYPGAALLAVAAASACGPGMVRYLGPGAVAAALHVRNPEAVCTEGPPDSVRVQAWLAGPGIDGDREQLARARQALASGLPTVVDAGALELVSRAAGAEQSHLVLTPHAGELAALLTRLGKETERAEVEAAPLAAARDAAALTGATVLLKGPTTFVASPGGRTYSQGDGTPSLATAGSGDTLAGILVALLAMDTGRGQAAGADPPDALAATAALAAAFHGRLGQYGTGAPLNAGMLAGRIPAVWKGLSGAC